MDSFRKDLRYALRRLRRSPGFTTVAVVSLALGIGANTAIFSIVNAVLLRGLDVPDSHELVEIYTSDGDGFEFATSSYPDYRDLVEGQAIFQDVGAVELIFAQADFGEENRVVMGEIVSGNYFDILQVRPTLGRWFRPEEDATPLTHPVVVISEGFWRDVYGSDPSVIGQDLRLNGHPYTILGVNGSEYRGSFPGIVPDVWVPTMMANQIAFGQRDAIADRGSRGLFLKARLMPGVTPEQADAEVELFSQRLALEYPETNEGRIMSAVPTDDVSINPFIDRALVPVAALLFTVVGIVLLVACANLASFLLARGSDRKREIAVRLALGAGRGQLVRQLLMESTVLAVFGGLGAVALASWGLKLFVSFQPPIPIPLSFDLGVDWTVFAFTVLVSLVAGVLFGLAPALQATKPDLVPTLKDTGEMRSRGRRFTLRNSLVVTQVAFSLLLLIGAGLFLRSLQAAQSVDPGFDTSAGALIWPDFQLSGFMPEEGRVAQAELIQRLAALPGVTSVGASDRLPLGLGIRTTGLVFDGVQPPNGREAFDVDATWIERSYFEAMDVPILRGRNFEIGDVQDAEQVAIISEATAARYFPGVDAVGATFRFSGSENGVRVIGIARDTKVRTLGEAPRPYVYFPMSQGYQSAVTYLVKGNLPSTEMLVATQAAALDLHPNLVIMDATTMEDHLSIFLFAPRMAAVLLSGLGGLALLLAAIGLYGIVSYAVSRRVREMGIRMSVGASGRDLLRLVVTDGMRLVLIGGVIGVGIALLATRLLASLLIGVGSGDPVTFIAVPAVLISVALAAAAFAGRRVIAMNPIDTLRSGG